MSHPQPQCVTKVQRDSPSQIRVLRQGLQEDVLLSGEPQASHGLPRSPNVRALRQRLQRRHHAQETCHERPLPGCGQYNAHTFMLAFFIIRNQFCQSKLMVSPEFLNYTHPHL